MRLIEFLEETVQPLPSDMPIEEMIGTLEQRLAAAKRGLGFANRMRNPLQKRKHTAAVLSNLNSIRGQLTRVINQMEQFNKAAQDYETGADVETTNDSNIQSEIPTLNRQGSRAAFSNT